MPTRNPSDLHTGNHIDLTSDDPIEIPDDDDVEIVRERRRPPPEEPSFVRALGGYPRAGHPHSSWTDVSQIQDLGLHVGSVERVDGDYVRIAKILQHRRRDHVVAVYGLRFRKISDMGDGLYCLCPASELVLMQDVFTDSIPDINGFYLEQFTPAMLRSSNKTIRMTNMLRQTSPHAGRLSVHFTDGAASSDPNVLVCRSVYRVNHNGAQSATTRRIEEAWENLAEREADPEYRTSDRLYRQIGQRFRDRFRRYNLGVTRGEQTWVSVDKIYTALDGFCGAGFASEGARKAKLKVVWSFDSDPKAMHTYRKNHRNVKTLIMDFAYVLQRHGKKIKVDVLMLSFPCQFFSPAKTRAGRNDDANEVAMFGLGQILAQLRPRIVVIEQTFGLDQERFRAHLMAVIAGFRDLDYSVRKGVINFAGLGQAGSRRRLIFIGAAPGEALPPFPRPTHNVSLQNPDSSLLPAVTVADALRRVSASHPDHNFSDIRRRFQRYDPRRQQIGTITCGRSSSVRNCVHWNGTRFWTEHELCLLQTAPPHFHMASGLTHADMWRQIGNGFPCVPAAAIYEEVVKSLRKTDAEDQLLDAVEASVAPPPINDDPIAISRGEFRQSARAAVLASALDEDVIMLDDV